MMKSISKLSYFLMTFFPLSALADEKDELCKGAGGGALNKDGVCNTPGKSLADQFGDITGTLMFVAGALAVIVIIIGGIRYTTSTGDAARIKQAKDTIFYGIAGLVFAILAFAIVKFIAGRF